MQNCSVPQQHISHIWLVFYIPLWLALTVAVICIAVARIVTKLKHKWDKLYEPLILIPWLLPSTMIALGLMMTYDEARWNLANKVLVATPVIMLIAYMIIKLPFSYRMIRAAFIGLDGNMEEAAQVMGAKPFYTMRKVITSYYHACCSFCCCVEF